MKKHLIYFIAAIVFVGCSSQYDFETPSGVGVKYLEKGDLSDTLIQGNVVSMHAFYRTNDDQVIVKTETANPFFVQFDKNYTIEQGGLIQEVFKELKVGDSVYFELPSKNLWEKSFQRPLPDSIDAESYVKVDLKLVAQYTREEYGEMMTQLERERNQGAYEAAKQALSEYLTQNNITPEITESGLGYIKNNETKGEFPQNGQTVTVKYTGTTLDGNVFDDGSYTFVLGAGRVIAGWDEGIGYFRLGESGKLYIPSELGYGSRGSGANIPPFSPLVFDVELLEIK
jgi:FKBP-type peptidyl-prolyl cis-trans isomerase FkpA